MKIYNRKIAQRIADCERRLHEIRSKGGPISNSDAIAEQQCQQAIARDVETLTKHGYDRYGRDVIA